VMPMAEGRADERLGLDKQHGEQHQVPRHGCNVLPGTGTRNWRGWRVAGGGWNLACQLPWRQPPNVIPGEGA
jgi:hypothetical protein